MPIRVKNPFHVQSYLFGSLLEVKMGRKKYEPRKLYHIWKSVKARCLYNYGPYKYYGGRNIKICDEWLDFYNFRDWALNSGYKEGLELDRKDTNGNYSPENCKWSTDKEQANNRNNNIVITIDNVSHTLSEWADIYKINYSTLRMRLRAGWKIEDALKTKINKKLQRSVEEFSINGESHSIYEWCKKFNKGYSNVRKRLSRGEKLIDILGIPNGK